MQLPHYIGKDASFSIRKVPQDPKYSIVFRDSFNEEEELMLLSMISPKTLLNGKSNKQDPPAQVKGYTNRVFGVDFRHIQVYAVKGDRYKKPLATLDALDVGNTFMNLDIKILLVLDGQPELIAYLVDRIIAFFSHIYKRNQVSPDLHPMVSEIIAKGMPCEAWLHCTLTEHGQVFTVEEIP